MDEGGCLEQDKHPVSGDVPNRVVTLFQEKKNSLKLTPQ